MAQFSGKLSMLCSGRGCFWGQPRLPDAESPLVGSLNCSSGCGPSTHAIDLQCTLLRHVVPRCVFPRVMLLCIKVIQKLSESGPIGVLLFMFVRGPDPDILLMIQILHDPPYTKLL